MTTIHYVSTGEVSESLHNSYTTDDAWSFAATKAAETVPGDIRQWHDDRAIPLAPYVNEEPTITVPARTNSKYWFERGYSFPNKRTAVLFKLTFGGAA